MKTVKAEILVHLGVDLTEIVERSLLPEVEHPISPRSAVEVKDEGGTLVISIEASDVTALRAAFNSYTHWVRAILDVMGSVG